MESLGDYNGRLETYAEQLRLAAANFNLISRSELDRVELHILDSVHAFHKFFDINKLNEQHLSGIDIGSGTGLPGIVLAILHQHISWVLLESRKKRLEFLEQTVVSIGLQNARAIRGRAEDFAHESAWRGTFDFVTARAVAPLPVLLEIGIPFLKVGGQLLCMKGNNVEPEMEACSELMDVLGSSLETQLLYDSPLGGTRALLVIRKNAETPAHFPRSAQRLRQESKRFHIFQEKQEKCFT